MMHSPFPVGTKISKLVAKGSTNNLADPEYAASEDSSLLADAKSAGYNVTRVKLGEKLESQSYGPESENAQRRRGKNVKDKRKK